MKSTLCNARWLARSVRVVLALTALTVAGTAAAAQPQPKSPVGPTWDCVLSGARNGVAYITFANDGTFSGYEVLVPTLPAPSSPRPALVTVATGSNGLGPKPSAPPATNRTDLFGAFPVGGTWGFDSKGRVVGSFLEVASSRAWTTTAIPISTNFFDSLEPVAGTNAFPVSYSVTFPLSTNKDAGTFKNQTVCYLDQVAVSTNCFDAFTPCCETNVLSSGFSTASTIAVNPSSTAYSNQVACYLMPVPLATNTFSSAVAYTATNHLPSGAFCVTLPIHTNLDLITFTERMTRYRDHVPVNSTIFTNPVAITLTNYLPDGTYCETIPLHPNTFTDTYVERMTCYLGPLSGITNTFESPLWIAEAHSLDDGTVCATLPIATNMVPGSFTEQMVIYGAGHIALSTNEFASASRISATNYLSDGTYSITIPLSTNLVASTFTEQTTCYASAVPVSVNTFGSASPYARTDVNPDGAFCITVPIFTNLTLISFTEQTTCYTNHVPAQGEPSTFVSATALTATNYLPDGTYCETVVVSTNTFAGTFTEQMTCYLEPVVLNSSTCQSCVPVNQTVVYPDGTYCVTQTVATNTVVGTYKIQSVSYLTQTDYAALLTNSVSFVGTVVPGKRLTLLGKSTLGGSTYRGVPAIALADISGAWGGVKQQNRLSAYEFLDLRDSPYAPNSYVVSGTGPGYAYSGFALLSSQKKIALACDIMTGTNYQCTRAVVGAFNAKKVSSSAAGLQAPSGLIGSTNRVSFQFFKRTSMP